MNIDRACISYMTPVTLVGIWIFSNISSALSQSSWLSMGVNVVLGFIVDFFLEVLHRCNSPGLF